MIDATAVAFDIDGVVADTMTLFLDLAREEFNIHGLRYLDIVCYDLETCLDLDPSVVNAIVKKMLDADNTSRLRPIPGAREGLTRLGLAQDRLLMVTARSDAGSIAKWMHDLLPMEPGNIHIVATGASDRKAGVLKEHGISFFVEDRLETCFALASVGITPIVFRQPWNRAPHPFCEVQSWDQLMGLMDYRESVLDSGPGRIAAQSTVARG